MVSATKSKRKFFALCTWLVLSFVAHDFFQERVFMHPEWEFGWVMTFFEICIYTLLSYFVKMNDEASSSTNQPKKINQPYGWMALLAIVIAITQGTGTAALTHVNFPVKVVFKSCKLVPTLFLSVMVLGKPCSYMKAVAAILLVSGVSTFSIADSISSPRFDPQGIVLLIIAIFGDAASANLQEHLLTSKNVSQRQLVVVSNLWTLPMIASVAIANHEVIASVVFLTNRPATVLELLVQGIFGWLGLQAYLQLVATFGAPAAVGVTTCRKMLTIATSFVMYNRPFTRTHGFGLAMVAAGLALARQTSKGSDGHNKESNASKKD